MDLKLPVGNLTPYYSHGLGSAYLGDSLELLKQVDNHSIDLICTSPPFALLRQKAYGNKEAHEYIEWFVQFAHEFRRVLKPNGSLVIDIGGTWVRGFPVRSLYHFELVLRLCKSLEDGGCGFHLAQELYWYNPAKLPTPAEWVTVRRVRVKDAVNTVWWLSPNQNPKASNRRVLKPYSDSQKVLMEKGYTPKLRPSEHNISDKFGVDNGGAIPPNIIEADGFVAGKPILLTEYDEEFGCEEAVNVIAASNTSSNDTYQQQCREHGIKPHPARFPAALPEFVINLCTEQGDVVLDPFAGSNTTGFVAEGLGRRWIAFEQEPQYLIGSKFRFTSAQTPKRDSSAGKDTPTSKPKRERKPTVKNEMAVEDPEEQQSLF